MDREKRSDKNIYIRVISFLSPFKKEVLKLAVLMICITIGNIYIPLVEQNIVDVGILKNDKNALFLYVILAILLSIITQFISFIQSNVQVSMNLKFTRHLQVEAFNHALRLKMDYIKKEGFLNLLNKSGDYIQAIADISGEEVVSAIFECFKFFGVVIGLLLINWKLTLFILLTVPVRLLITSLISKRVGQSQRENLKVHGKMHRWEEDIYSAAVEIKMWNLYEKKSYEYEDILIERDNVFKKLNLNIILEGLVGQSAQKIFINLLFVLGGALIWSNEVTMGGLLAFMTYSNYLMEPIGWIAGMKMTLEEVKPALKRYDEFFSLEEEQMEGNRPNISQKLEKQPLNIDFKNISFSYESRKILDEVNLNLKSGDVVALLGENGAGKSTLINLLLRLYVPQEGVISINGNSIQNSDLYDYRNLFSVVMQDPYLFLGDIRSNLTLFDDELELNIPSEKLLSFIERLPDKEFTNIGSDSSGISGGEKQKIALYRALLKKSRILVLDEPTSNYDIDSEDEFVNILKNNKKDITIVITHNPKLLGVMNKILYLKEGKIQMYRNYKDLVKCETKYVIYGEDAV